MHQMIHPNNSQAIEAVDRIESDHPDLETLLEIDHRMGIRMAATPRPLGANCLKTYKAKRISGLRPLSQIRRCIIHCTQGATARAAASWFTDSAAQGSAHLCLDDTECYRTLEDNEIPWGAPGANYSGFHIEQAGFVTWTQAMWSKTHRKTIMRCAYKTAFHCRKYGIPRKWLTVSDLKADRDGITDHMTCTLAFGGSHTDPGPNYPRMLFMALVRSYYAAMKVKLVA